jgi:hypothetical protein
MMSMLDAGVDWERYSTVEFDTVTSFDLLLVKAFLRTITLVDVDIYVQLAT